MVWKHQESKFYLRITLQACVYSCSCRVLLVLVIGHFASRALSRYQSGASNVSRSCNDIFKDPKYLRPPVWNFVDAFICLRHTWLSISSAPAIKLFQGRVVGRNQLWVGSVHKTNPADLEQIEGLVFRLRAHWQEHMLIKWRKAMVKRRFDSFIGLNWSDWLIFNFSKKSQTLICYSHHHEFHYMHIKSTLNTFFYKMWKKYKENIQKEAAINIKCMHRKNKKFETSDNTKWTLFLHKKA